VNAGAASAPSRLHFDRQEIDEYWSAREIDEGAYSAKLRFVDAEMRMYPGEIRAIFVAITNTGTAMWPWG